jgi:alpha-1,2-mannosyltransferase
MMGKQDVRKHIHDRFGLQLSNQIQLQFVHLHPYIYLLKPAPFLSLLLESMGAMCLAYIGLYQSSGRNATNVLPDLFIDTTGCAFTYLPASILFGCRVLAYVHYPTISSDMLQLVWERRRNGTYNHQAYIAASAVTTYMKLIYYVCFAFLYGCIGSLSTVVLVNSTWTYNHIHYLWKYAAWHKRIRIVYPPCSLPSSAANQSLIDNVPHQRDRLPVILSIGQFRPEKDHALQIKAMAQYLKVHHSTSNKKDATTTPQLVLIGGCRNPADEMRLHQLQELCTKLQISQHVTFVVNEPFSIVQEWLQKSSIGIHTVRRFFQ